MSGLLAGVAPLLFISQFLAPTIWTLLFWLIVVLMLLWMMTLALLDVASSHRHYSMLRREIQIAQSQSQSELDRLRGQVRDDTN